MSIHLTRVGPGGYRYTTLDGREWVIVRNDMLARGRQWVAYDANDKSTVLDPLPTLMDVRACFEVINVRACFE